MQASIAEEKLTKADHLPGPEHGISTETMGVQRAPCPPCVWLEKQDGSKCKWAGGGFLKGGWRCEVWEGKGHALKLWGES